MGLGGGGEGEGVSEAPCLGDGSMVPRSAQTEKTHRETVGVSGRGIGMRTF